MTWIYNGKTFADTDIGTYVGFVYVITEVSSGKKYVGKKGFWSRRTLKPLKGKTRKRKVVTLSDWKDYYGSSDTVKLLLEKNGPDAFKREILHLCESKGEMSYMEAKVQFEREVLLRDDYYNGIINCRINRSHVTKLKDKLN